MTRGRPDTTISNVRRMGPLKLNQANLFNLQSRSPRLSRSLGPKNNIDLGGATLK